MITIIHGDDIDSSRNYYLQLRKNDKNSVIFEGEKLTLTDLEQNIHTGDLFGKKVSIFIEDILTKKSDKLSKVIIDFLIKNQTSSNIFLWESKEIQKKSLFKFKEVTIKIFILPKNIFTFLDSLRPNNFKHSINLFHKVLTDGVSEELIFFMLQRQVRLLLSLLDKSKESIEEVIRLASWQRSKLVRQAKFFSKEKLLKIHNLLYKIEVGHKTGSLNLSLSQSIDFLLYEL